jgi:hypothetical protein
MPDRTPHASKGIVMSQFELTSSFDRPSLSGASPTASTPASAPSDAGSMADLDPETLRDPDALREELRCTRRELDRALDRQRQIMELIGCKSPDKLIHDMRNVMNEVQLLKLLASTDA